MRERERERFLVHMSHCCSFVPFFCPIVEPALKLYLRRRMEKFGRIESEKNIRKKKSFPPSMFSIDNGKCIYIFFIWLEEKMK